MVRMSEGDRGTSRGRLPPVPPCRERGEYRDEVQPGPIKDVAIPRRVFRVADALDDAIGDQFAKARREQVPGDAEVGDEVVEPVNAQMEVPQDQRCPPVTHHFEGPGE